MKIETVRFPGGSAAAVVSVAPGTPPSEIGSLLELPAPRALVILNGGTAQLDAGIPDSLSRTVADGLARFAAEEQVTLITGGTEAGIFALYGQGIERFGRTAPSIGVALAAGVNWPGQAPEPQAAGLEPHHSHFVLVEGREWGDETATMYGLAAWLARSCKSVALFAGGGEIVLHEMQANVDCGRPMVLLAGSGRSTDAVLTERAGTITGDERLAQIAQQGRIVHWQVTNPPGRLRDLLRHLLLTS